LFLDTRTKIIAPSSVNRDGRVLHLVLGYFDPFTAEHARALRALPQEHQIVVTVCDPADRSTLMDANGRAQVIAGLKVVSAVLIEDRVDADVVTDLRSEDDRWSSALRERVARKRAPV
jgi:hypothetical protein